MKRSEALEIIKTVLVSERSNMLGAEKILDALEKAGMLPPGKDTGGTVHPLDVYPIIDYSWDEE
jgi:hypothetical protein